MEISIIAAVAKNGVIGKNGGLPWHISEDLARFKRLTIGHPVIMGRKTYEDIIRRKGKALKDRTNIVLSKNGNFKPKNGVIVARDIDEAVRNAKDYDEICFVIGGSKVYKEMMIRTNRMYLTEIKNEYEGDTFFPTYKNSEWREIAREDFEFYSFVNYRRIFWSA